MNSPKAPCFRTIFLCFSLLIVFASLISPALSQNIAPLTIGEGKDERFFKITEGYPQITLTFHIEQKSNESSATARIYATDLWDLPRARAIYAATSIKIEIDENAEGNTEFTLDKNSFRKVTVKIDTSKVQAGTYSGKIVVFGVNTTDVEVPLKIQVRASLWWLAGANLVGIVLGFVALKLGVKLNPPTRGAAGSKKSLGEKFKEWLQAYGAFAEKYLIPLVAAFVLIAILFLISFQTYYSRITDFGAEPVDYIAAILFGLGQYGAGKATVEAGKGIQDKS